MLTPWKESYDQPLTSQVAQTVKCLSTMQETWVQALGWEDSLEKEMATHSSMLGLENLMYSTAWWAAVHGITRVGHNLVTKPPGIKVLWRKMALKNCTPKNRLIDRENKQVVA